MALKLLRLKKGYTLQELAAVSGVNYMKIHQIETGKIKPENLTVKTALKLSKALDCTPEDLVEGIL